MLDSITDTGLIIWKWPADEPTPLDYDPTQEDAMPFPSYDEGDIAQFKEDDEYYNSLLPTPPSTTPVGDLVCEIEKRLDQYEALCAEIVTTLVMDENAHWFKSLPSDWHERTMEWSKRLERLSEPIFKSR